MQFFSNDHLVLSMVSPSNSSLQTNSQPTAADELEAAKELASTLLELASRLLELASTLTALLDASATTLDGALEELAGELPPPEPPQPIKLSNARVRDA
jgi:hypothetical protein